MTCICCPRWGRTTAAVCPIVRLRARDEHGHPGRPAASADGRPAGRARRRRDAASARGPGRTTRLQRSALGGLAVVEGGLRGVEHVVQHRPCSVLGPERRQLARDELGDHVAGGFAELLEHLQKHLRGEQAGTFNTQKQNLCPAVKCFLSAP